jgi:hypothetical protein
MTRIGKQTPRHRFILNPYAEERFAICPECNRPTEQRKFPMLIHVDPRNPVSVNKTCCYCPDCDLLIAHRDEVEAQLAALFEGRNPELIGNDYLVIGTLDPDVWERGRQTPLTIPEMMENLHDFEAVLRIQPADERGPLPSSQRRKRPGQRAPGSRKAQPTTDVPRSKPKQNDPCWCGSGKKYKNCHMRQDTT